MGSGFRRNDGIAQSTYSELTDSPNAILRIVSARSSATESWRMAVLITTAIVLVLFLTVQKHLTRGLLGGGVK